MERHAAEVLRDALALPAEWRAALIDSLVDSLDQEVDEDAEEAWKREIYLRLQQIDNGAVELIPWPSARLRLRDRLERSMAAFFESTLSPLTKPKPRPQ